MGLEESLEKAGFRVSRRKVEYVSLTGERIVEEKVTGYSSSHHAKVSYVDRGIGERKLYISLHGRSATRSVASKLESMGGMVDVEEDERVFAVFRVEGEERASDIVRNVFGTRNAHMG